MQSKLGSIIEVCVNTIIGFGINYTANLFILPHFGFTALSHSANFQIGVLYTGISVCRSYVIRRWFNQMISNAANSAAQLLTRKQR